MTFQRGDIVAIKNEQNPILKGVVIKVTKEQLRILSGVQGCIMFHMFKSGDYSTLNIIGKANDGEVQTMERYAVELGLPITS